MSLEPLTMQPVTAAEQYAADKQTIKAGTPGIELMERAGKGVTDIMLTRWPPRPVLVVCGTGNNGGDGFVIARLLTEAGWPVTVTIIGDERAIKGDAAEALSRWRRKGGALAEWNEELCTNAELVVDAIFGVGVTRPLEGGYAEIIGALAASDIPSVAVDMPSGLHADSGEVMGIALPAVLTITFHRPKWGLLRGHGPHYSGDLVVVDIGLLP